MRNVSTFFTKPTFFELPEPSHTICNDLSDSLTVLCIFEMT